jgi:hypothetical protein
MAASKRFSAAVSKFGGALKLSKTDLHGLRRVATAKTEHDDAAKDNQTATNMCVDERDDRR